MFELFSDIFTYRDNLLTRIDPRVKLLIAFAILATNHEEFVDRRGLGVV